MRHMIIVGKGLRFVNSAEKDLDGYKYVISHVEAQNVESV